jgi:hypothetical protein
MFLEKPESFMMFFFFMAIGWAKHGQTMVVSGNFTDIFSEKDEATADSARGDSARS